MNTCRILLFALLPLTVALGGGKHLEIMAPLSRQQDFHGKPQQVIERCFEGDDGKAPKLLSTTRSEFDADGNALRIEEVDEVEKKTDSEIYQYDAEGTWTALVEQSGGASPTTFRIFLDAASRRIAHVDAKSKQTEFYTYSAQGFELGTVTKTSTGKVEEQTTMQRNAANKEERVVFEEPPGKKTTEMSIQWSDKGFQTQETMIMHDEGGDRIVVTFEYPEVDAAGNWLVQIKKQVLHQAKGETIPLPTETNKREIKYHP
ncbi:hypothetical protein [Prosthecobacter sp.]|uniref:hypothetical protein n=1 Tax=Prosthecobacter sp. TaxID=1965333 RepID=UPI002AB91E76|nr:hypothetical protein [Prosthecobacter sp.]MDZ4402346.1 hypothetical protein [Prosthecobacter sp.]